MTDYTVARRNDVLNYWRGAGAPPAISGVYLELFNGDPQSGGASVQSTITGSANRTNVTSAMGAASSGSSTNASVITVTAAAVSGATVTHLAIYDAVTSGALICSHALSTGNLVVSTGNPVQINANGLTLSLA